MIKDLREEVIKRFILAKWFLQEGEVACSDPNDQIAFSKGILLLHDAVESALGAIANKLNVKITTNFYLLQYIDSIDENNLSNERLPNRENMKTLNTLRNNIKHGGIFPDPKSNRYLSIRVRDLIEYLSEQYLDANLIEISMKSLIRDDKVRERISIAEQNIENEEYEKSLINPAYATYEICESSKFPIHRFSLGGLGSQQTEEGYGDYEVAYLEGVESSIDFLERGVDPRLYRRFKELTPIITIHRKTRKSSHWWDRTYGHSKNWTRSNALFGLDFCIDVALKFQRKGILGSSPEHRVLYYEDVIEPTGKEAIFWSNSIHPSRYFPHQKQQRYQVKSLTEGNELVGHVSDNPEWQDEWFVQFWGNEKPPGGFVMKSDVTITTRKRTFDQS